MTQLIEMIYVYIRAATLSEMIALKAVEDPMLIRESAQLKMHDRAMALTGM
jgi:hypothetical protein